MKINIQKWTRAIPCLITIIFVLLFAVAPAYAAALPGRYYTFNEHITAPSDANTYDKLLSGVSLSGQTYEGMKPFSVISLRVTGLTLFLEFDFNGSQVGVASFNINSVLPSSTWLLRDYQTLYFPNAVSLDSDILEWLEDNGTFTSEPPLIGLPDIDLDDIFDSDILENEYMAFADIVGIFIRNTVTAPFIFALFGLVLVSFILYGKK